MNSAFFLAFFQPLFSSSAIAAGPPLQLSLPLTCHPPSPSLSLPLCPHSFCIFTKQVCFLKCFKPAGDMARVITIWLTLTTWAFAVAVAIAFVFAYLYANVFRLIHTGSRRRGGKQRGRERRKNAKETRLNTLQQIGLKKKETLKKMAAGRFSWRPVIAVRVSVCACMTECVWVCCVCAAVTRLGLHNFINLQQL